MRSFQITIVPIFQWEFSIEWPNEIKSNNFSDLCSFFADFIEYKI